MLFSFSPLTHAQYRTSKTIKKEYYPGGSDIHRVIKTKIKTDADVDWGHYYKRTVLDITEFDESGMIKSQRRKIHNSGNSGRLYHDVLYDEKVFDEHGVMRSRTVTQNDARIVTRREYDQHGKLIFKSKVWRK
jgi:nuclear transport factor 2 (NTF2) superfamily protein